MRTTERDLHSRLAAVHRRKVTFAALAGAAGLLGVGSAALAEVVGDPLGLVSLGLFGSDSNVAQVGIGIGGGSGNGYTVATAVGGGSANARDGYWTASSYRLLALGVGGGNANGGAVSAGLLGGSANGDWDDTWVALGLLGGSATGDRTTALAVSDSGCAYAPWVVSIALSMQDGCNASAGSMAIGLRGADGIGAIAVSDSGQAVGTCQNYDYVCGFFGMPVGVSLIGGASGEIAVSGTGPANSFSNPGDPGLVVSGTGPATGTWSSTLVASGTGQAFGGSTAVSGLGSAEGSQFASVAPLGNTSSGYVALSGTGNANGGLLSISGTGESTGGGINVELLGWTDD